MENLTTGIEGRQSIIVEKSHTAVAFGSGDLEVFATPSMIALMEQTAMKSVSAHLDEGNTTVGTEVNIKHLKASPIGCNVTCSSQLIKVNGKELVFEVKAYDDKGEIGSGTHTRYIVDKQRFMSKF